MVIVDIFSKRQKRESGQKPDVFLYDSIPEALRIQVVHILLDVLGRNLTYHNADEYYQAIHDALAREYGLYQLARDNHLAGSALCEFIQHTTVSAQVLDAIELCFRVARKAQNPYYNSSAKVALSVPAGIEELNQRFLEAGVGYQYESDRIIRIDSQFVHAEIVKPALVLLSDPRYRGAQDEFLNAHKHYREGNYKECLTDGLKAFESTMKAICEIRNWTYNKTDTAKTLIDICFKNGLIPTMLQSQLNALQTILESGVPTVRNKMGGHGQGPVPTVVPPQIAAYTLHLAAANIVLLATLEKNLT